MADAIAIVSSVAELVAAAAVAAAVAVGLAPRLPVPEQWSDGFDITQIRAIS